MTVGYPYPSVIVDPQGVTSSVTIVDANGNTARVFSDAYGLVPVSLPASVSALTVWFLPGEGPWTLTFTQDGTALPAVTFSLEDSQAATVTAPVKYARATQVGSGVQSVTAADTTIVIGGTGSAPTVATGTLDVIATDHPPAAAWSNNSKKITGLANGTAATDAAAFGQIPVIDSTATDITAVGTSQAAGGTGKAADAGHAHKGVTSLTSGSGISITGGTAGQGALTISGGLIAHTQYSPGSEVTKSTTSTSFVAVDTTNLAISFTAPSSGSVLVRLGAFVGTSSSDPAYFALFGHGTTTLYGQPVEVLYGTTNVTAWADIFVTGLTPGSGYAFDWAWGVGINTGTLSMYCGAPSTPFNGLGSPAIMEVWAA